MPHPDLVVWVVTPCSSQKPDSSEDRINSIFGIKKLANHETTQKQAENRERLVFS
jgi:hypothetical protein